MKDMKEQFKKAARRIRCGIVLQTLNDITSSEDDGLLTSQASSNILHKAVSCLQICAIST